jgi:hypothetical protein
MESIYLGVSVLNSGDDLILQCFCIVWVLLLPFVDESRISAAFNAFKSRLSQEEVARNSFSGSFVFIHESHPISVAAQQSGLVYQPCSRPMLEGGGYTESTTCRVGHDVAAGFTYQLMCPPASHYFPLHATVPAPSHPPHTFQDIRSNTAMVLSVADEQGQSFSSSVAHSSSLLPGHVLSPPILNQYDLVPRRSLKMFKGRFNLLDIARPASYSQQMDNFRSNYHSHTGAPMLPSRMQYRGYESSPFVGDSRRQQFDGTGSGNSAASSTSSLNYTFNQDRTGYSFQQLHQQGQSGNVRSAEGLSAARFSFAAGSVPRLPSVPVPSMNMMRQQLALTLQQQQQQQQQVQGRPPQQFQQQSQHPRR